jgi:ABC-type uncharacterized transport system permease subunit
MQWTPIPIYSLSPPHLLCRKVAISQAANGQTIEFMITTALGIAKQWKWSKVQVN